MNSVKVHVLDPMRGYYIDDWIIDEDIAREDVDRFVTPEGEIFAIITYIKGEPQTLIAIREVWEKQQDIFKMIDDGQDYHEALNDHLDNLKRRIDDSNDNEYKIRIHHGRITDPEAVEKLISLAPAGFKKVQDVLLTTEKYVKKSGFFSSERSRLQKMRFECYELKRALEQDGFMTKELSQKKEVYVLIEFLSLFSDACPNWRNEYNTLSRFIPTFF